MVHRAHLGIPKGGWAPESFLFILVLCLVSVGAILSTAKGLQCYRSTVVDSSGCAFPVWPDSKTPSLPGPPSNTLREASESPGSCSVTTLPESLRPTERAWGRQSHNCPQQMSSEPQKGFSVQCGFNTPFIHFSRHAHVILFDFHKVSVFHFSFSASEAFPTVCQHCEPILNPELHRHIHRKAWNKWKDWWEKRLRKTLWIWKQVAYRHFRFLIFWFTLRSINNTDPISMPTYLHRYSPLPLGRTITHYLDYTTSGMKIPRE